MKEFIKNEMMVHIPLCSHKDPKNVLIISDNIEKLEHEIQKHDKIDFDGVSCTLESISKLDTQKYDVVISELNVEELIASQINRVLKDDGIVVNIIDSLDNIEESKKAINTLGKYAKIVMPFHVGKEKLALLASKEYHPTADLILQRSDMLDNLDYYNCDVHLASFAMGNYIRKEYLGVIKN